MTVFLFSGQSSRRGKASAGSNIEYVVYMKKVTAGKAAPLLLARQNGLGMSSSRLSKPGQGPVWNADDVDINVNDTWRQKERMGVA